MARIVFKLSIVLAVVCLIQGCVAISSPVGQGFIFTNVKEPVAAGVHRVGEKVGTSTCVSVLGMVAVGDASIQAAMEKAEITRIHHVDRQLTSVLFFFARQKTMVYGE
jgi:hypothetical protein